MRILVTGGAGFVGSVLVPELLFCGHTVIILDWFLFRPENDFAHDPKLTLIRGDIRDKQTVNKALKDVDIVIHLAAMANDPSSEIDHNATKEINLEATCAIAKQAKNAGVQRFINASSASVYGLKEEPEVTEELSLNPQTIYAKTKAIAEEFVLGLNDQNFTVTSVRPATLSGFSRRMRLDLTVNIFVYQAICLKKIKVFGGTQYRPNLAISDMVRAYLLLLMADKNIIGGKTFNLNEGNYRVREIAEFVREIIDHNCEITYIPSNDFRSYRLSANKVMQQLGFVAHQSLRATIENLTQAFQLGHINNPDDPKYRNIEWLKRQGVGLLSNS